MELKISQSEYDSDSYLCFGVEDSQAYFEHGLLDHSVYKELTFNQLIDQEVSMMDSVGLVEIADAMEESLRYLRKAIETMENEE